MKSQTEREQATMNAVNDLEAPSNLFESDSDGLIHTTSLLHMLRLTVLDDYRVLRTGVIPRSTILNGLRYRRVWYLIPPKQT